MKLIHLFLFLLLANLALGQQSITWETPVNVAGSQYSNLHPRMVLGGGGNPMIIWGRSSDQSMFFSRWNGTTFSTPVKLNGNLTIATASWMGPDIAAHGDTVYVVMKETPESETARHIYLVKSFDGGSSFSSPQQIDQIADSISRFPTLTTDAQGNPIVAFMKFNDSFKESRWAVTKSSDYGSTFSIDTKASGWGNSASVCDCCPGSIVSNGNQCLMLYRDNNNNLRDTWLGISDDGGASFRSGINIDHNNWMINSCPATGPDGVAISDTLYSVFCSGASGAYRAYFSKTSLSDPLWVSTQNLGTGISGLSQQNYPRISAYGKALGIVSTQVANGSDQLPLWFTNDVTKSSALNYSLVDMGNITTTDIVVGDGALFVCWEDDAAGIIKFRKGSFKPASSGVAQLPVVQALQVSPNPCSDFLNITVDPALLGSRCMMYDFSGRAIKALTLSATENTIEMESLPSGLYLLQVEGVGQYPIKINKQ